MMSRSIPPEPLSLPRADLRYALSTRTVGADGQPRPSDPSPFEQRAYFKQHESSAYRNVMPRSPSHRDAMEMSRHDIGHSTEEQRQEFEGLFRYRETAQRRRQRETQQREMQHQREMWERRLTETHRQQAVQEERIEQSLMEERRRIDKSLMEVSDIRTRHQDMKKQANMTRTRGQEQVQEQNGPNLLVIGLRNFDAARVPLLHTCTQKAFFVNRTISEDRTSNEEVHKALLSTIRIRAISAGGSNMDDFTTEMPPPPNPVAEDHHSVSRYTCCDCKKTYRLARHFVYHVRTRHLGNYHDILKKAGIDDFEKLPASSQRLLPQVQT